MAVQRQDGLFADAKASGESLLDKEFYLAKRGTDGKFYLAGNGDKVAGVISEGRDVGYHSSINTFSQLKCYAGGTITAGDNVQSDATHRAVSGSTNSFGVAINSAVAGEMVEVDFAGADRG